MLKMLKKDGKGITLIALVVTIIVLLILAGISISVLTGENGILGKTTEAKSKNERSEALELARMEAYNWYLEKQGNEKLTDEILRELLTGKDYVYEAKENSFLSKKGMHEIFYYEVYDSIETNQTNSKLTICAIDRKSREVLRNIEFSIYRDKECTQPLKEDITIGEDGSYFYGTAPNIGEYYVKVTRPPEGYSAPDVLKFTITDQEEQIWNIEFVTGEILRSYGDTSCYIDYKDTRNEFLDYSSDCSLEFQWDRGWSNQERFWRSFEDRTLLCC